MKQSQTSTSNSPWLMPALLAVVAALVIAGCKTQAITPPGGAGLPVPMPSGGIPIPGGGSTGGTTGGSTGGSPMPGGGSTGGMGGSDGMGGSTGDSGGSTGSVGSVPQIEMPGDSSGVEGGDPDGDPDGDADGDPDSTCGETDDVLGGIGGIGGMGQAGECLGTGDGSGEVGQFPAESDAERAERLGRELEESVGGFDEVMMEEQREVAAVGRSTEGFGGGSGGGAGEGISLGEQSDGGSGGSVSIANPTGPSRESPIAGMSDEDIRKRTPEDIPVTVDDDIISRQLREAALAEEDPELRERLWEEYRKYRGI